MRWFALVLAVGLGLASPALAQTGGGSDTGGGGAGDGTATTGSGTGTTGQAGTSTGTQPPPAQGQAQQPPPPAPPPSSAPPPPPPREEDDDGRSADLLWIEGAFGYSYVDLVQFDNSNFLPNVERLKGSGWSAAAAAGIRLSFLMIGGRATLSSYEGFDLWTLGGEIHLRIPIGALEPYARIGVGYGFVGQANYDTPADSEVDVFGLVLDGGAGLDIYLDKIVAIGVGMDAAFLNLSRQRVDMDGCMGSMTCTIDEVNFQEDGDAAGLQLRLHAHASLHF